MRAALLLLALAQASSGRDCSSLLGPACPHVNALDPPRYVRGLDALDVQPSEDQLILDNLLAGFSSSVLKRLNVTGSFKVVAHVHNDLTFDIHPVSWIAQPGPTWSMIALAGRLAPPGLSDYQALTANVFDPDNVLQGPINGCSVLELERASRGIPELRPSAAKSRLLEGSWEGQYTCHNAKTKATLNLIRDFNSASKLYGIFKFHAKR